MIDQNIALIYRTPDGFDTVLLHETTIMQVRELASRLNTIENDIDAAGASYFVCSSSKYAAQKEITTTDLYIPSKLYALKFAYGNLEPSVTIKFSSEQTAHPVKFQGAAVTDAGLTLEEDALVLFLFDGSAFHLIGNQGFIDETSWS